MSQTHSTSAEQRLATPVQFLKGVGPDRVQLLSKLKLRTVADVLFRFPRDYQDLSQVSKIAELEEGAATSVVGVVEEVEQRTTASGKVMVGVLIRDETDYLRATWFNQPFVRKRFQRGNRVMFSGLPRLAGLRWEMVHPQIQNVDQEGAPQGEIMPVYPLTEGLKQTHMRRIASAALENYLDAIQEVLPAELLEQEGLCSIRTALSQVHFPQDLQRLQQARQRLVFQELLVLQLALAIRRGQLANSQSAQPLAATARIDARIRRLFPFALTAGQEQAIAEVAADLNRTVPMNRLLQGDVGSGKTLVAVYAMLVAVANGCQATLMAPTEVLARQHFSTLSTALSNAQVRLALWTGGMSAAERRETQQQIEAGEIDLVVGTQALLYCDYQYPKLALVVIDEQHKFGVVQRATLRDAGIAPHYLVMTATPIPRTVALTTFGDLDVSVLRDHPPGRQIVHTYQVTENEAERWWAFFRKQLREGRQGFVITPRLEESPSDELVSLQESFESLCNGELEEFRLDLVHGRLSAADKQAAMDAFRNGQTQVLVATSVVEVGVDIPNAAVMTIENAERFGLAQLHQLRGRVGRGAHPGYVGFFSATLDPVQQERLSAFAATTDGFELAELDFRLRGPGELLGTRQHGLPPLWIADLTRDGDILLQARAVAQELVASQRIKRPAYLALLRQVVKRYGASLQLGDVG